MEQKIDEFFLNLMKKTLSFTLWPEPPAPIALFNDEKSPISRFFITIITKILSFKNLQIVKYRSFSENQRIDGEMWPVYADTMIGLKRLDNLQYCVENVLKENIEGDLIETGVWRGGACIFMRAVLLAHGIKDRKVFVADSFEGLPKPDTDKYHSDKGDQHHVQSFLAVSKEEVENNFKRYDLLDKQVIFLKGWFKDTLPQAPIDKLSILRLDGDMYGSTMDALENLYPKLSKGGYCIIDDYALQGCRSAVDDYRIKHSITSEIKEIDRSSCYWKK